MAEPNMSKITASLERDLQNFSLNNDHHPQNSSCSSNASNGGGSGGAGDDVSSSDLIENHQHDYDNNNTYETAYELNSHIRMPYHWEQCLDLKTGELYYINWKTGMKSKEDPRTSSSSNWNVGVKYDSIVLEEERSYESEGSTTEESSSSPSTTSEHKTSNKNDEDNNSNNIIDQNNIKEDQVLVVAGCKICFMYFMVLKQVEDCPKCTGQLIHFASS